jgi:hypothetical protein
LTTSQWSMEVNDILVKFSINMKILTSMYIQEKLFLTKINRFKFQAPIILKYDIWLNKNKQKI